MKTNTSNVAHLGKREFKEKIYDYTFSKDWKYKGELPAVVDFYADCLRVSVGYNPLAWSMQTDFITDLILFT